MLLKHAVMRCDVWEHAGCGIGLGSSCPVGISLVWLQFAENGIEVSEADEGFLGLVLGARKHSQEQ